MTDWCLSKITFLGPEQSISDLVKKFDGQPNKEGIVRYYLFGGHFLPQPDYVRQGGYDLFREWAWDHWGCKYGAAGATLEHREEGVASFMLKTDWNPPVKGLCWLTGLAVYRQVNVRVDYEMQADSCDPYEITDPYGYCVFTQGQLIMEATNFVDKAEPISLKPQE